MSAAAPGRPLRLAVVGCGAVGERYHLPAIARSQDVELAALVDTDLDRATALGRLVPAGLVTVDLDEAAAAADAAIVAVPNRLHAAVAVELLRRGLHVLVEKPMASTAAECDEMIAAAEAADVGLAVGLDFRFFATSRLVKELLSTAVLGELAAVDLRQGGVSRWPMASPYLLTADAAGGGVLVDWGVHMLDLLLWWLGDLTPRSYADDAAGGVEADCEATLELGSGARCTVVLSRTRQLSNTCRFEGERGLLEVGLFEPDAAVRLTTPDGTASLDGTATADGGGTTLDAAFDLQLEDFVAAVRDGRTSAVPGSEGRRSVAIIEALYARRAPLRQAWDWPEAYDSVPAGA